MIDLRQCDLHLTEVDLYPNARYIASELPDGARISALVSSPDPLLSRFAKKLSESPDVQMGIAASEEQAAEWLYHGSQSAA